MDRGPWDGSNLRADELDRAMMMAEVEVKATGGGYSRRRFKLRYEI